MDWISKLERKFGRYAIHNVMRYVIILQMVGLVLSIVAPTMYYQFFAMNASAILDGQVWRVVTFLMDPPSSNLLFVVFVLYLYYMIGESLESVWGAFRFNIYLLGGIIFHVLAAILAYLITGMSFSIGTEYLYLSLFFAFAVMFPNTEFLLFFILPIKVKYLAMVNGLFFAFTVLQGILPSYTNSVYGNYYTANAIAAFVSLLNFALFYFSSRNFRANSPKERKRKKTFQREVKKGREGAAIYANGAKHKCAVCGRTELDDPNLEFRYCSKCKGNFEYCQDHLFTHEHIK